MGTASSTTASPPALDTAVQCNFNDVVGPYKGLNESPVLWTAYLVAAFEPDPGSDMDPDSVAIGENPEDPTFGEARDDTNGGAIYLQPIGEIIASPQDPKLLERHVVVHEIGHQGGGRHDDGGIMAEGAPVDEARFAPTTIRRFREESTY